MDNIFENFVENLIVECLKLDKVSYMSEQQKKEIAGKLRNHFYQLTIKTLIDQLSDDQISEIKDLGPEDPMLEQKFEKFAAEIPGFAVVLEDTLKKESDKILQTGQMPVEA